MSPSSLQAIFIFSSSSLSFSFFPLLVSYWTVLFKRLKAWRTLLFLLGLFTVYLLTFSPTHPYNQAEHTFFLRNKALLFFSGTFAGKMLFFLPIAASLLFFSEVVLYERSFLLLYPATLLFFLPIWLIEQRYYLIPFTLF